jgi:hypothetical protein
MQILIDENPKGLFLNSVTFPIAGVESETLPEIRVSLPASPDAEAVCRPLEAKVQQSSII